MQFLIELMVVKRQTPNTVHSFHAWASCSVFRLKTIKIIKPRLKSSPFHIGFSSELSRCERVGYLFRCSHCWSLRAAIYHQSTPQRSSWCASPPSLPRIHHSQALKNCDFAMKCTHNYLFRVWVFCFFFPHLDSSLFPPPAFPFQSMHTNFPAKLSNTLHCCWLHKSAYF